MIIWTARKAGFLVQIIPHPSPFPIPMSTWREFHSLSFLRIPKDQLEQRNHPYSILTEDTRVESVVSDLLSFFLTEMSFDT